MSNPDGIPPTPKQRVIFKKAKKPTHRLKFLNKATEERGEIGAGWADDAGNITLVLNPMVTLRQSKDLVLTLFIA